MPGFTAGFVGRFGPPIAGDIEVTPPPSSNYLTDPDTGNRITDPDTGNAIITEPA